MEKKKKYFQIPEEGKLLFCLVVLSTVKILYIVCNPQWEVRFFRVWTLESSVVGACSKVSDFSDNMSHSCVYYCIGVIVSWVLQRKPEKN